MTNRVKRLRSLVNILNAQVIVNQEQIIKALSLRGIQVTQATLSRDLHDLKAEKQMTADGTMRYVVPVNPIFERTDIGITENLFRQNVKSIDFCERLAVVKTTDGFAAAIAKHIDEHGTKYILGTIAGNDTILVIPRENTTRDMLYDFLYVGDE